MYLTQGLHRASVTTPHRAATVIGDRVRTFAEQIDRVARFAAGLHSIGVESGDRVAMLAFNSDRYSEYLLAVPWADAVLNPVNIRWSPVEVAYALNDSDTKVLLVDDTFAAMAPALRAACANLETIVHCGDGPTPEGMVSYENLVESNDPVSDARRSGDELAGLFYTGGTTGFPKGVMLSHTNLVTSGLGTVATGQLLDDASILLHAAPMFHLADLAAWVGQVMLGGTHVMVPFFEPTAVLEAIQKHSITDVLLVPTMIQLLVDHPSLSTFDTSSLSRVLYGGSPISAGVLERTQSRLPRARLTQAYGMTELAPVASLLWPEHHVGERIGSAGRAAPHSEIQILDPADRPVETGAVGEICVRGGHVMLGYWNKPAETAAAIRDGWMHTGDVGYLDDDGFLFVVDRLKDMIITGGENVYSAEVESALSLHPAILACAVIGVPDPEWGERVHACVVLTEGLSPSVEELREHTRSYVAGYKTPRTIEFVTALPMSGAGKIMKRELRTAHESKTGLEVSP
ncbi:long-chain-fatty-acid--CoA ligase [Rhodococcus sp. PAMC28707]|uniref:acyl-CoA synthetase n=1 Tax=unclassified Rhodococcus (in: high G+C Gram-positive bacteria) TaxID=192944 RepID=UPI00109DAF69|nr:MULTISPECIES: long-chain fatty acid--CoA ligase [unclassified Rhodococcus (in: high G+C Gram-positive bacteria)]QCB49647.1 long-chain-fatty-acid--CoA ligase [Rhodococcus sp. PAMC28705]QCB58662.1 long-chain-fatty-acid--CoA ligase [Rhodococcus sp. PAMC28707]